MKRPLAVDTLGNLLALHVTPASIDERVEVGADQDSLVVVKLPEAKQRLCLARVPLGMERSFAGATRSRCLVKDCERYASTLVGLHLVAFVCLMLKRAALLAVGP